ncbi:TMV resistance protein N-like [Vigna radiata var. radiata]|uniref:TMV resistance protein N-like n=1 Tax=Vigna radiata var. radiata TaxID=3916 RepID=A0A1S3UF28_VIGRR|nr:TMV resistance protein N-like [Vigna radiata var. radiata]
MEKHGEEEEFDGFSYDVFISFRGEDAGKNFVGHLRRELGREGINTFNDDRDMRTEEGLSPAVCEAIEESNIFIVVFSENYASSTWCLDELVKIIQRTHINSKQVVYPVFYHVDPSDTRKIKDSFEKHMMAHENEIGKESQRIQAWRSALFEAASLPGMHVPTGNDENDIIEKIVEKVRRSIAPKPLYTGENVVGLKPRVEEVMSLLDMKPNDKTVRMLGIYGLGGIGKTKLAKALYDKIVHNFDAASFLADVRENSKRINGMEDLQKTLLSEMFEELETELGSAYKGIYEIKRKLHRKKLLLVLDDVDDKEELEKLAGGCDWFGPGSRIIVTTREKDVLNAHHVGNIYEMKELDEQHSLELFCWNAFGQGCPKTGFQDVSVRAAGYAKGVPLAIQVIASDLANLHEESLDAWEDALEEYEKTPSKKEIQDVLKISYDRLDVDAKQVFLDIACFFKGERMEYVKKILKEFCSTSNMKVLVNKSLITIENDRLKMHDLIQDMGRQIVRQEAPDNPGQRSRILDYEDVIEILTKDSGSDKIQGIKLDPPKQAEVKWSGTEFGKMKWLRILIVRNTSFSSELQHLPNHLRLLHWDNYPSKSFPQKFHPKKIVVFNLPRSSLTFQDPFKKFPCLTNMDFSYNQRIIEIPDVSELQNLRELRLDHCRNLIAVHQSVGFLKKLSHLSVSECTKLQNFLSRMFLPSLEVFDLNLCERVGHFPEIMQEMTKPLKIYMINTGIQELPESISKLIGLVFIDISNNRQLKYLPSSLFMLPNVDSFKIEACSKLGQSFRSLVQHPSKVNVRPKLRSLNFQKGNLSDEDLLAILCYFPKLEELIVSENNFVYIPSCIKECGDLTSLDLNGCKKLKKIPELTSLRILDVHHCSDLEEISELPSTVEKVDARFCFKLTKETSDMLWCQVKKGVGGIEMVMPLITEIPEWFNFVEVGTIPGFWVRGKFPNIVLAMIFHFPNQSQSDEFVRRRHVDLRLVINGRNAFGKGYHNFIIEAGHVLICDLRVLFSEKEWFGLDALLEKEWNVVQVEYEATSSLMISSWGVFLYEEGSNMEDLLFNCPNHMDSEKMPPAIVPEKDPMEKYRKMIRELRLDETFKNTLTEWQEDKERGGAGVHDDCIRTVLGESKKISKDAEDALKSNGSALEDPNSYLRWLLDTVENDDGKPKVIFKDDLALIRLEEPVTGKKKDNVGEASSSGHQESKEEEEGYDIPFYTNFVVRKQTVDDSLPEDIVMELLCEGMRDGLVEAQNGFPSLDIAETSNAVLEKGDKVRWAPEVEEQISVESRIYMTGIYSGLKEAKLRFPDLDIWATINTVAKRKGIEGIFVSASQEKLGFPHLDWSTVKVPPSEDPLMQIFMKMKQQSNFEGEVMNKLFWKLKEEHEVLRNKFAELDDGNENEYDECVKKREEKLDGVGKYEEISGVLRERGEEIERLYDAGVEGFKRSEEFEDVMGAIYLNGLRAGLLEAQALLLNLLTPHRN